MKYKIGDLSRAFSISKSALRYYEEKGILSPEHLEGSDYRYYSDKQMHQMGSLKKLRNLGFSVDEIREFFNGVSLERLQSDIENLLQQRAEELERQHYLAEQLQLVYDRMKDTASHGVICHSTLSERYELQLNSIQNLVDDRSLQKEASRWFDNIFPVINIHRLSLTDVQGGVFSPVYALSVDTLGARLLDLPIGDSYVVHRPQQTCLSIFAQYPLEESVKQPIYAQQCKELLTYCETSGLVPVDAFYFNVHLVYLLEDHGPTVFGELALPVTTFDNFSAGAAHEN